MATAPLSRQQTSSALLAGAVAHTIFQTGWFLFGFAIVALIGAAIFGNIVDALRNTIEGDVNTAVESLGVGSDILFGIVIAFLVASLLLILLAFLVSASILRAASLRRPGRVTLFAIGITAVVDIALFWVYFGVAQAITESAIGGLLLQPVLALVGGVLVGMGVWSWMAWANRDRGAALEAPANSAVEGAAGPAVEPAAVQTPAEGEKPAR